MIHVLFFKTTEETQPNPGLFFKNVYAPEWFDDPLVKRIIREIDSSESDGMAVLGPLGSIGVEKLSGTAKTLILLLKCDVEEYFEPNLTWVGDNGFQLFADIGKEHDIYCVLTGSDFNMRGVEDFDFYCVNDKSYGHGREDWLTKLIEYCTYDDMEVLSQSVKELCDGR